MILYVGEDSLYMSYKYRIRTFDAMRNGLVGSFVTLLLSLLNWCTVRRLYTNATQRNI
jgi:hypothetical protein